MASSHRMRLGTGLGLEPLEERRMFAAAPELVADINPSQFSSNPQELVEVGTVLYFNAKDGTSGEELWKSDGTDAGTIRVKDIWRSSGSSQPRELTNVAGTLYFSADDGIHGRELWVLRPEETLVGDLNSDGSVDAADAGILFGNWGGVGIGDFTNDGIVDAADAGILLANWTGDSGPVRLFPTNSHACRRVNVAGSRKSRGIPKSRTISWGGSNATSSRCGDTRRYGRVTRHRPK